MKARIRRLMAALALCLLIPGSVLAQGLGHPSYTYNFYGESVPSPDPYTLLSVIDGVSLGCGPFSGLSDLSYGPDGSLFVADADNNRIVVIAPDGSLSRVVAAAQTQEGPSAFQQPRGVFAGLGDNLFVADTLGGRVLHLDGQNRLILTYGPPKGEMISADFNYRPLRLTVDQSGRLYVVAAAINDGVLMFNQMGEFEGFLAAARVNPDPIRLLWKRLATKQQRDRMEHFVPVEYNSVALDSEGFLYATTAAVKPEVVISQVAAHQGTEEGAVVRRLNMLGQDILRRKGYFPQVGDVENLTDKQPFFSGVSQMMDVAPGPNGVYYLLDNNRKRIFAYDHDGYMLYAFSGPGPSQGGFVTPSALAVHGELLAVADRGTNLITVYKQTEYARDIAAAIDAYTHGQYDEAGTAWQRAMAQNANLDMAYSGMGKAAYRAGDYQQAMTYFSRANLREWYSKAFNEHRKTVLAQWFGPVTLVVVGGFMAWRAHAHWRKRKGGAA